MFWLLLKIECSFPIGKRELAPLFAKFSDPFEIFANSEESASLFGRALCLKQATEFWGANYVDTFSPAYNSIAPLFDLPKFQESVWAERAKTCTFMTGQDPRPTLDIPAVVFAFLLQILPRFSNIWYVWVCFCLCFLGRAGTCWAIKKEQVVIKRAPTGEQYVEVKLNRKTKNPRCHQGDKLKLQEHGLKNLSPVQLAQKLFEYSDNEYLCPVVGGFDKKVSKNFYKMHNEFLTFFVRLATEEKFWDLTSLDLRWHSWRRSIVGISQTWPDLSIERVQMQTGHKLSSRTTKDIYLFNALQSPGFDTSFEEHLWPFLTFRDEKMVKTDQYFPSEIPRIDPKSVPPYKPRRKRIVSPDHEFLNAPPFQLLNHMIDSEASLSSILATGASVRARKKKVVPSDVTPLRQFNASSQTRDLRRKAQEMLAETKKLLAQKL